MSSLESFSRRHGGHGGGDSNVERLSQGVLGRFGEGCSHGGGEIYRDIPVMCKGSIE